MKYILNSQRENADNQIVQSNIWIRVDTASKVDDGINRISIEVRFVKANTQTLPLLTPQGENRTDK